MLSGTLISLLTFKNIHFAFNLHEHFTFNYPQIKPCFCEHSFDNSKAFDEEIVSEKQLFIVFRKLENYFFFQQLQLKPQTICKYENIYEKVKT